MGGAGKERQCKRWSNEVKRQLEREGHTDLRAAPTHADVMDGEKTTLAQALKLALGLLLGVRWAAENLWVREKQ